MLLFRHCVEQGRPVPRRMYRAGIDRNEDHLLAVLGVKHFHLGAQNSSVLLYAVEFDDAVYLLEINDHQHLDRKPVGKILEYFLRMPLRAAQAKLASEAKSERARADEIVPISAADPEEE